MRQRAADDQQGRNRKGLIDETRRRKLAVGVLADCYAAQAERAEPGR